MRKELRTTFLTIVVASLFTGLTYFPIQAYKSDSNIKNLNSKKDKILKEKTRIAKNSLAFVKLRKEILERATIRGKPLLKLEVADNAEMKKSDADHWNLISGISQIEISQDSGLIESFSGKKLLYEGNLPLDFVMLLNKERLLWRSLDSFVTTKSRIPSNHKEEEASFKQLQYALIDYIKKISYITSQKDKMLLENIMFVSVKDDMLKDFEENVLKQKRTLILSSFSSLIIAILLLVIAYIAFSGKKIKKEALNFNIKKATDKKNLLAVLKSTPIEVQIRTGGRKTEHTEKWVICHLLATLADINFLTFPLSLQHDDKPDFILEFNKTQFGVEVTEAIPPDYAKCVAMAEKINADAVIDMSLFKWGSPPKSTSELKKIISKPKLTGPGWTGNSPEIEWANYIHGVISTKLKKLNNAGYKILPDYWLSIYDNLPLNGVNAKKATDILISKFSKNWKGNRAFTHIFIETGPIIIDISGNTATIHNILDLWS